MKRIQNFSGRFLALLLAMILCNSCSKSVDKPGNNSSGNYFVKFKVDGASYEFTKEAEGNFNVVDASGSYDCSIAGIKDESAVDKNTFALFLVDSVALIPNFTYINYGSSSGANVRANLCQFGFFDDAGTFFSSWGDEFSTTGIISDTKIKLTEVTSAYLKGTFSGTMYKEIDGTSEKHNVTEGEFYVKRDQ